MSVFCPKCEMCFGCSYDCHSLTMLGAKVGEIQFVRLLTESGAIHSSFT